MFQALLLGWSPQHTLGALDPSLGPEALMAISKWLVQNKSTTIMPVVGCASTDIGFWVALYSTLLAHHTPDSWVHPHP